MSPSRKATTASARYDSCLLYIQNRKLPPGYPVPQPTSAWPAENVTLLERYRDWLMSGGASPKEVDHLYVPMAGHALGLNLKPHCQIALDGELEQALDYVRAKHSSAEWTDMCRVALDKFRRFLRQERGQSEADRALPSLERYQDGLPEWLVEQLARYQHIRQRNWRPARLREHLRWFWSDQTRPWRWLCQHYPIATPADLKRCYLLDYVDHRLSSGHAVSGINADLRNLRGFLLFLQDQGLSIPHALLRVPSLKQPDTLPKFLTDEQVRALRDDLEARVAQAGTPVLLRDALLDRAAFYLLWHGGLRLGELEELRLDNLDLPNRKLMVRRGKGQGDRAVYLTGAAVQALQVYLAVRGLGPSDHVFLYRNAPLCKDLVRERLHAAGRRAGVKVYPHRLRHTCATQLLNAGCRVTSIQKFLGHRRLNSTMIYARVHDQTVAEDYYAAMERVEQRLQIGVPPALSNEASSSKPLNGDEREQLLDLAGQLAKPDLNPQMRIHLVERMRRVLNHNGHGEKQEAAEQENGRRPRAPPPPSPASSWVSLA